MKKSEKYSFPVEGMTCASCVARVEKAIAKVEGVNNVSVNFATEKVNFETTSEPDLAKISEAVENAGYKIVIQNETEFKSIAKPGNDDIQDEYYERIKKDFILALIFTIPVFFLSMTMDYHWVHRIFSIPMDYINRFLLILTTPVVFISGRRFFSTFFKNVKHLTADMNSLVAVGTGSAYVYSTFAVLFPEIITSTGKAAHVYFDSAAVIITLILLGRLLESRAKHKTGDAVKKLLELKPKTAIVKRNGKELVVRVEELMLNDIVIIKPGEKIPADGIIDNGFSVIDESMISGESMPVEKKKGDKVIGGTINKSGAFEFIIIALGSNSVLGKIIKLVEEAQGSKAPIQKLADKIASVFVPVVIVIAIVTFVYWFFFSAEPSFNTALINFVAVLIIACPCALGLATPTAIIVGIGKAAGDGILIKNGESLEIAHKISTIIFDKTGTLTEGKPAVADIVTFGITEEELISLAASSESKSEHPVARGILAYAEQKNIKYSKPQSFNSITGFGITSLVDGYSIVIGNEKLMNENSVNTALASEEISKFSGEGKTILFIAIDGIFKGLITVADPVKDTSFDTVAELKRMGINVVMLTGDNKIAAQAISAQTGIENFISDVLPHDKAEMVQKYKTGNNLIAVVGDGINDSPALAKSDLGIAMGSGTDIAIETADIVIIQNNLMKVPKAIKLSGKIVRTIKQNLFWAFIYNIIGIPLAAVGALNPMFAALAMSFSSVSVVMNSLRLRTSKIK